MSSTITDAMASNLRSLSQELEALGAAKNHAKEIATIQKHLDAFDELDMLHRRAGSFSAPVPESVELQARLAAGKPVKDAELIDYAARATAAGATIGTAAQRIVMLAQNDRVRSARDVAKTMFPSVIDDLRRALGDGGAALERGVLRSIKTSLTAIDKIAGKDQCDYWLITDHSTGQWSILVRGDAERLEVKNQAYDNAKQAKARETKSNPPVTRLAARRPRALRRDEGRGATIWGTPIAPSATAGEISAHRAAKEQMYANPRASMTQADLERELQR